MKKRASLEDIAKRRHMTVKALVIWAMEQGGNPNAAGRLIGISPPSIVKAMERYGLAVETVTRVVEKEMQP